MNMSENNNGFVFHPTGINGTRPFGEAYKAFLNSMCGSKTEDEPTEQKQESEEWVWVEGYKGTDKDMKCHGNFQYEMNKQFDMPEGSEIKECESGFHLCRDLKDVFNFFDVRNGNRFFKVTALVRKTDFDNYGKHGIWYSPFESHKLAAKSIIFLNELTADEILKIVDRIDNLSEWTDEDKKLAILTDICTARKQVDIRTLIKLGYSETFAKYCLGSSKFETAKAVGSLPNLSMDMKVYAIFNG